MQKKLYAFWKHDQFPFALGGEVTDMRADGAVETIGYGKGYWFTPFKILPLAEGRKLAGELLQIKLEYDQKLASVRKEFVDKCNDVLIIPK